MCSAVYTKVYGTLPISSCIFKAGNHGIFTSPPPLLIFTIVVEDCLVNMTCTSYHQVQNKTKKLTFDHSVFLVIPYHTSSNISAVSQTIFSVLEIVFLIFSNFFPPPTFYILIRFFQKFCCYRNFLIPFPPHSFFSLYCAPKDFDTMSKKL